MGPVDPVTGGRNLGPIGDQIRQTLRNMEHMLESAGSSLDRIVKITIVLADAQDYDEMNRIWREFFPLDPVTVRLVHVADNKPVEGAVILGARTDMGPAGMPEMTGKVTPLSSDQPGFITF